jgi:hypothetical protein
MSNVNISWDTLEMDFLRRFQDMEENDVFR